MRKWPNPTIFTSSLFSKHRKMMSKTDSTTDADWRFDSPCAATALIRSFFVTLPLTSLDRSDRLPKPSRVGRGARRDRQRQHRRHRVRVQRQDPPLERRVALALRLDHEHHFVRFLHPPVPEEDRAS